MFWIFHHKLLITFFEQSSFTELESEYHTVRTWVPKHGCIKYARVVLSGLTQVEAQRKLGNSLDRTAAFELLNELRKNVIDKRYEEGIDYLLAHIKRNGACVFDKVFRRITTPYINWV